MNFQIKTEPSLADPHNWTWTVSWSQEGQRRFARGPAPTENVISGPIEAKVAAERYARTMAAALARATEHTFTVTVTI